MVYAYLRVSTGLQDIENQCFQILSLIVDATLTVKLAFIEELN